MEILPADLPGILILQPRVFSDSRGFFLEAYHEQRYQGLGLDLNFVQDNHSHSKKHVLRGLHYQVKHPQGKLIFVISGEILDVAVDIRQGSPTFGKWTSVTLSAENHRQIYVPPGFAHGFCVLSDSADTIYKCTDFYYPDDDKGILWNDPQIGISWPVKNPILSEKDAGLRALSEISPADLPR